MRAFLVALSSLGALAARLAAGGPAPDQPFEPLCKLDGRPAAISPLPSAHNLNAAVVALGRSLFHEPRLSADGTLSCASCHPVASGGDDARSHSVGINGQRGDINAPSVLNRAFDFRLFWDGRAATLEDQVDGPLQNPIEMGSTWELALSRLEADPAMRQAFDAAFPGKGISREGVRMAIATYERSLITPRSPFDRYLCGDEKALSARALAGYRNFQNYGCVSCHQGRNVGGNMYQRFGVMEDYFALRGGPLTRADLGRFNQTGKEEDKHVFKVPSLRNVALTAPYFHDGSQATLEGAVRVMARVQLGRVMPDEHVQEIVAFLESLTGEIPEAP
jgi:cytochrome c peroxidase